MKKLRYVGDGAFIPGIPASDHECGDAQAAVLVKSGVYEYLEPTPEEVEAQKLEERAAKAQANAQAAAAAKAEKDAADKAVAEAKQAAEDSAARTKARIAAAKKSLAETEGSDGES